MKTPAPPLDEDPAVAVYDGRLLLGFIYDRSTGCIATDPDRRPIGQFPTWKEAARAIHKSRTVEVPA